jgi:hypothetical protein
VYITSQTYMYIVFGLFYAIPECDTCIAKSDEKKFVTPQNRYACSASIECFVFQRVNIVRYICSW